MKNLKNNIEEQFPKISIGDWEIEAQKSVKGIELGSLLNIQLTDNISIRAIYEQLQDNDTLNLSYFDGESHNFTKVSINDITNLPLEADLEVATIIELLQRKNIKEAEINLSIDTNFFLSIAKFRAIRHLLSLENDIKFKLIACSPNHNKSVLDNKSNLIRLTIEAMSAYLGTADFVELTPFNSNLDKDDFGKRITDNIKLILEHESHISKVLDPLSGAYLVENLTSNFINSVNKLRGTFNQIDTEKDLYEYVSEQAVAYSQGLKDELDRQERKLIGVNIYQNPNEKIDEKLLNKNNFLYEYEYLKAKLNDSKIKVYIANFDEKHKNQLALVMAFNTFNIQFQVSSPFELVEDAFNSIKLYDPDLVILNCDEIIKRNLTNMLADYTFADIQDFSPDSMVSNISMILEIIKPQS